MPKPTPEQSERAKKGIRARQDAIAELIKRHQEEFDELHTRNRVALGLPIAPQGPTRAELEERIRKQEERLEKWKEQLRQAGGEQAA